MLSRLLNLSRCFVYGTGSVLHKLRERWLAEQNERFETGLEGGDLFRPVSACLDQAGLCQGSLIQFERSCSSVPPSDPSDPRACGVHGSHNHMQVHSSVSPGDEVHHLLWGKLFGTKKLPLHINIDLWASEHKKRDKADGWSGYPSDCYNYLKGTVWGWCHHLKWYI